MKPNKYEIEVLEMLDGTREKQKGAWINACLEFLEEMGLAYRGRITARGKQFLINRAYGVNGENVN